MPSEINGDIQNAQPEIHQDIQIKKEGEVKMNETDKEVENGIHKETESDKQSEAVQENNGNVTPEEVPVNNEHQISSETVENDVQKSQEETIESEIPSEENVEHVTSTETVENQQVSEDTPLHDEEVSDNNVELTEVENYENPPEVSETPLLHVEHVEEPAENKLSEEPEVCKMPEGHEVEAPAEEPVAEVTPKVEADIVETPAAPPVEADAEERAAIGNYSQKLETEKNKQVEKEYTKEVIESEVPARIVEEVKKGFERCSSTGNSDQGQQNGVPKKASMFTSVDDNSVKSAYEDVRNDSSETQWAVFKFDGPKIKCSATGASFDKFQQQFGDNERAFGFIRVQTGDEMSKRQKFLFITWVGPSVSVLQRAKMSTDKSFIKNIISNFAVELQLENQSEIDLKHFVAELNKAGGAHYGTGVREN